MARTTEIAAAYITGNTVAIADLGDVIETIGRALKALGREDTTPASARAEPPASGVSLKWPSIQSDHLVCLICGKRLKTIRRHLSIVHQLTPEAYRELFGLKPDYPVVASGYSRQRSEMARRSGLVVADKQRHEAGSPVALGDLPAVARIYPVANSLGDAEALV